MDPVTRLLTAFCFLFTVLIPVSAQDRSSSRRDRFTITEHDGVYAIARVVDGLYSGPEQFPDAVKAAMKRNAAIDRPRHRTTSSAIAFVVSDAGDAEDSDLSDIVYDPPTLRSAIQNANKIGGTHAISFSPGLAMIQPATNLPSVTVAVSIDGSVAAGKVVLDGSLVTNGTGLLIGSNSTIQNVSFENWSSIGLALGIGTSDNVVKRCQFKGNHTGLNVNSSNSTIGGTDPEDRNTAGNNSQTGIALVFTTDITVQNNFCGTLDGTTAAPNTYDGLYVLGTRSRVLNNVLSGNADVGLSIGEFSVNTLVRDNIVGLDSSGQTPLRNSNNGIEVLGSQDSILSNIVSGNGYGITVAWQADQTLIKGNLFGPTRNLDTTHHNWFGGIYLVGTPVTVDSNIVSGNRFSGININGYGGAVITRNKVGTDPTGMLDWGNTGPGVNVVCDNNTIGGSSPSDGNILSGNGGGGIEMFGGAQLVIGGPPSFNWVQGNVIRNNKIGTDVTGTARIPNYTGLFMNGYVDSNEVRDNLISGNQNHGIWTRRSPSAPTRNVFRNNKIGTQADGTSPLPNDSTGFMVDSAGNNIFGGENEGEGNIIAFSNQGGITVKAGWGMKILRNKIFANHGLGIDLGNDGPTPNDSADVDEGANRKQNFPRITWIGQNGASTTVRGRLESKPATSYRLEFYTNDEADSTGFGEGEVYQTGVDVVTDSAGVAAFEVEVPGIHGRVVGTATDAENGTSEFSKAPFVVNSVADRSDAIPYDGLASTNGPQVNGVPEVTLRSALQASNQVDGEDDISFNIPGSGAQFIIPQSALPLASDDVTIDGSTQPGYNREAVQLIQLLGTNAGSGSHGLRLDGDRTTVQALYVSAFQGDGIHARGRLLTLIDVTANTNKGTGAKSSHDIRLEGESIFSANGPAASSSPSCEFSEAAGIWVDGWLLGEGKVTTSGNCGSGIRQTTGGYSGGGIQLDAGITASNNSGPGIWSHGDIVLKGERFDFISNGSAKSRADGVLAAEGAITIEATGTDPGPNIRANGNSSDGIRCDLGPITLKGRAQANNNGAGLTVVEAFNRKITGIWAEGTLDAEDIEVKANGLDGMKARESIRIKGNVTASNHPGRGIWGITNITIEGTEHFIEGNKDGGIWAANGYLRVKGLLTVRNNTVGGHHGEEDSPYRTDAKIGAVEAVKFITTEDILFEDNVPTGLSSWGDLTIRGNAVVRRSRVRGIHAQGSLLIEGNEHAIVGNGGDGIVSHNGTLAVRGHILLEGNGGVEEDEGFGAYGQHAEFDDVTARGNVFSGVFGHSGIRIRGRGVLVANRADGATSEGLVSIAGGRVCENIGYGIAAPVVRISGTQICNNGRGGVSGRILSGEPGEAAGGGLQVQPLLPPLSFGPLTLVGPVLFGWDGSSGTALVPTAYSSSLIRGSSITGNEGDGVNVDSPYPFRIEGSNISGNSGFGVANEGSGSVSANDNWWGNAAGPGGAISGAIEAVSWQASTVGVYVGVAADSLFVLAGDTGSVGIVVANWSSPADSLVVNATDGLGWMMPISGRTVSLSDSIPAVLVAGYVIPENAAIGDVSTVFVVGASQITPENTAHDTLHLVVYSPTLSEIVALSDTLFVTPGDTVRVTAIGIDQSGRSISFPATWMASGGMVDSTGLFIAGPDTGLFTVWVSDTSAGLSDSAFVRVLLPAVPVSPGSLALTSNSVNAGTVASGQQSAQILGITNLSGGIVRIDSMRTNTAYFSPVWDPDVNLLREGDTLTIEIVFSPDSARSFTDTLFIYSNSPGSPLTIPMTGNGVSTGVSNASAIPDEYELRQNFPNPFNPSTTIRFGVPFASRVTLRVYDILGREVSRLVDGIVPAGYHDVVWGGRNASGVYFYRIEAVSLVMKDRRFAETKRMLVLK